MTQAPPLDLLSAQLVTAASRLARSVSRASGQEVPSASLRLLSMLDEYGASTVGELAAADRCAQPTMSAAVGVLRERGWVAKIPHPQDGRSALVDLTDDGRRTLADARRRNAATIRARLAAVPDLGEHDLAAAVAVLERLLQPASPDPASAHQGA